MKNWFVVVPVLAAISGCSVFGLRPLADSKSPVVEVVNERYIRVDQEPVIAKRGGAIAWKLATDGTSFPDNGIVVDEFIKAPTPPSARPIAAPAPLQRRAPTGKSLFECGARGTEFVCQVPSDAKPGFYAYTIRVKSGSTNLILDPSIFVEE